MPPTLNFQKYSPMLKDSNEKKKTKKIGFIKALTIKQEKDFVSNVADLNQVFLEWLKLHSKCQHLSLNNLF